MLVPNKYINLDNSVLKVGADILAILKNREMASYDEVLNEVVLVNGEKSKSNFLYALDLLLLLGKVEYFEGDDLFKYK